MTASLRSANEDRPADSQRMQLLDRAFDLLELMAAANRELSLSELAQMSGLPLPTTHRAIRSMAAQGYARQLESKRYTLGPRLIGLGDAAARMIGACAQPHLSSLVDALGESASMWTLDDDHATVIAQAPARYSMRWTIELGLRIPLHSSASGKALLASMPPSQAAQLLRRSGMRAQTPATIVDSKLMKKELEKVRKVGHAEDRGEYELGLYSVAVSVPNAPVPVAISVAGPESRLGMEPIETIVRHVRLAAEEILRCT